MSFFPAEFLSAIRGMNWGWVLHFDIRCSFQKCPPAALPVEWTTDDDDDDDDDAPAVDMEAYLESGALEEEDDVGFPADFIPVDTIFFMFIFHAS